jgi:methanogenic corrinoid protein MtbC1
MPTWQLPDRNVICIREEQHREEDKLKPLYEAIVAGKLEPAVEITRQAIAEGVAPQMNINNYMIKAMGEVVQRFQEEKLLFLNC